MYRDLQDFSGKRAIVTGDSKSGLTWNKPQRQAHYNAAKAGVPHMTRSLAGEWAVHGIRVNAVAPTYVNTPMSNTAPVDVPAFYDVWMEATPMRRMVEPEEVAAAITFLASRAASGITGAVLTVDGGYTIWGRRQRSMVAMFSEMLFSKLQY